METLRLRKLQQPSHVERLLEAFLWRTNMLLTGAYRIRDPEAIPPTLQRLAFNASQAGQIWMCWARGLHTWLFTCEMSLPESRERGATVLHVNVYGDAGDLSDTGSWVPDQDGKWQRCANC